MADYSNISPFADNEGAIGNTPDEVRQEYSGITGYVWYRGSDVLGGTVTSVGLSAPTEFIVYDTPVKSSGTIGLSWASQTANKVLASPDGASGVPSFRALTKDDLPANLGIKWGTRKTGVNEGTMGEMYYDDDYFYICTKTGGAGTAVWKRAPISLT